MSAFLAKNHSSLIKLVKFFAHRITPISEDISELAREINQFGRISDILREVVQFLL